MRRRGRPDRPRSTRTSACCAAPTPSGALELQGRPRAGRRRDETLDQGVAGQAVVTGRPFWTGDYVADPRFPHLRDVDRIIEASAIRSVMAVAAHRRERAVRRAARVERPARRLERADAGLLEAIADQAAITIRTTRLIDELDRSRDALARRAERRAGPARDRRPDHRPARARRDPPATSSPRPAAWSARTASSSTCSTRRPATCTGRSTTACPRLFSAEERAQLWISVGVGATGTAVAEDRVVVADDDLAALFPPSPESTEFYERTGFHSMIAAPITGEAGPLGVIEVYSKQRAAFTETDGGPGRRARQPGRHRDHQRPAHRGARSLARASSPGRPTPSGRCARSPAGSARRTTRTRSSRRSSTRRSGCSARPGR